MKPDLEELTITEKELESLSGFDVSELFVGGVLGGVYRPSIFQNWRRSLWFFLTEIFVAVLIFVFTIPIGLAVTRNAASAVNQTPVVSQFLLITLGLTLLLVVSWNIYMWLRAKRLKTLMHLLDEIDRYNEVLLAVDLVDRLEAVGNSQVSLTNRNEVLEALRVTRSSLVSALMTEKILRENRGLLARRHDLLSNIENNLATLRTLEVSEQANEYGQLLNEALQIGMSVYREVQRFSR